MTDNARHKTHDSAPGPDEQFSQNGDGGNKNTRSSLFVGSVDKCFTVINAFKHSNQPLSLTEIANKTGLGKSAAQRFCHTLITLGYLTREEGSRRMHPAVKMMELSHTFLSFDPLSTIAAPHLLQARQISREAVNLALPLEQDVILIARLPSSQSQLAIPLIGGRAPMFCTSSGRAYLSTLSPDDIESILDKSVLEPLTRNTITDRGEILKKIEQVTINGFTTANQECINGEISIGAPIWGHGRVGIGSVNICVTVPRWTMQRVIDELAPIICQTAHDISLALSKRSRSG